MNLDSIVKKMSDMAKKIQEAKGPLELLGLFLREDSPDLWDVVISAPWLKADERASFEYVAGELRKTMTDEELRGLSRVVILDHDGAVLKSFLNTFKKLTGLVDLHFTTEGGAIIRRAYIIVAHPLEVAHRRRTSKRKRPKKASS